MNKKEAMLKIFPGIHKDSPCSIKTIKIGGQDRLALYYNETILATLSKEMEEEYKEYIGNEQ